MSEVQNQSVQSNVQSDTVVKGESTHQEGSKLEEALQRTSSEAKRYRLEKNELKGQLAARDERINALENATLEEQGKYKEQNELLKKQLTEEREGRKKEKSINTYNRVTSQVKEEAAKMGCQSPSDLISLLADDKELDALDYDEEDFSVKSDSLKQILERAREKRPFLFNKSGPSVHAGSPSPANGLMAGKPINEMTNDELDAAIHAAAARER